MRFHFSLLRYILDFKHCRNQRQASEFLLGKWILWGGFLLPSTPMAFSLWLVEESNSRPLRHESASAIRHNKYAILHELFLTNHHSSLEHAIYGTSCLLLAFLSPTTCHLSNLRSINLILSLSPLSCLLSFFFLCWGFVLATIAFPQHNSLKKKWLDDRQLRL